VLFEVADVVVVDVVVVDVVVVDVVVGEMVVDDVVVGNTSKAVNKIIGRKNDDDDRKNRFNCG